MGAVVLGLTLLPGLVDSVIKIMNAIKADSAVTPEQVAAAKAELDRLSAALDAEADAVESAPDVR